MNKLLSVIIPAYNEEYSIELLLNKVMQAPLPSGFTKEVIVINDGSTDKTGAILSAYAKKWPIILLEKPNGGKASALKMGLGQAAGDVLLIQDADLEYDPIQYSLLLHPIVSGETQVVYGSRFLGNIKDMRLINRVANNISNWTMRLLWGANITDINTCYKIFTKQAFAGIDIKAQNFAIETEITIKFLRKGLKIVEVPITYRARSREEGKKIKWRTAIEMYWPIIAYKFRH